MKIVFILIEISALLFHYLSNGVEAIDCELEPKNNEGRLRKDLFCSYDNNNRPTLVDGPISIRIKMIVKGFTFSDSQGTLSMATWLAMSWTDEHLKWDAKKYNNLATITQSSDTIWQPDLALYNSDVDAAENEFCKTAHCVITSSGTVSCIPPCSHSAKCQAKYDRWPFDLQNCTLHIGTWVNSGDEIDYTVLKTVISEDELTSQNMEWQIIRATYKRNPGNYNETKQTYPSITYSFLLERHSGEYKVSIFCPAFAMTAINLITLWVDSRHNRRIQLLSLNMVLHFLSIQHLFYVLPHNGDTTPDILIFHRDSLFITILLMVMTIILQGMLSFTVETPEWIGKINAFMENHRFGQLFLTKHLVTSFTSPFDENADDVNLVDPKDIEKNVTIPTTTATTTTTTTTSTTKKPTKSIWQTFANIIDRILFVTLFLVYLFMIIDLLPERFFSKPPDRSIEIVGY